MTLCCTFIYFSSSQRELQLEDVQSHLQQELRERMAMDGENETYIFKNKQALCLVISRDVIIMIGLVTFFQRCYFRSFPGKILMLVIQVKNMLFSTHWTIYCIHWAEKCALR